MAKKGISQKWSLWKKHTSPKGAEGHSRNLNKRKELESQVRNKTEVWVRKK